MKLLEKEYIITGTEYLLNILKSYEPLNQEKKL
jgi:hypothetical protein